jgi:hypothetical protein
MPVTARLSKRFYEVLGEDIATELVTWFNDVDATYRADLRELNELNFGRFDAKLEQRLAELDAKWGTRWTELDAKLDRRLAELDARWGVRWTELDAKLELRLGEFRADLRTELAGVKTGLRWMLAFWAPTALAVMGTGAGMISLLLRR